MPSSGRGCELVIKSLFNLYENRRKEVQEATARSHILQPILQDLWPGVQLLHVERHAPCH